MTPNWINKLAVQIVSAQIGVKMPFALSNDIEAAMLSVAARVEEETIRRCRQAKLPLRAEWSTPAAINHNGTLAEYSQAIAALPRKYQEPDHE